MCLRPFVLKASKGLTVPCGKCAECKRKRASQWAFRLSIEDRQHIESHFVTLTYSDNNLPRDDCGYPTLVKADLQNYFKRLRFNTGKKIKYFACGEYGGRTNRPHYHAVIYGASQDEIINAWRLNGNNLGHVHLGTVSNASARYVANYLCKSVATGLSPSQAKEFQVMSVGLGKAYLSPDMIKWHRENAANYVAAIGKVKQSLPRYYKDKIFTKEERIEFGREHTERVIKAKKKDKKKNGLDKVYHNEFESKKQIQISANYRESLRNKI